MSDSRERKQVARFNSLKYFIDKKSQNNKDYFGFDENDYREIWEYDFKFQYNNRGRTNVFYNLDDEFYAIERIRKYKNNGDNRKSDLGNKSDAGFDCDGSGEGQRIDYCELTRQIYRLLWNWEDYYTKNKVNRYGFAIFDKLEEMGPETINSFATTYNEYNKLKKEIDDTSIEQLFSKYAIYTHTLGNFLITYKGYNNNIGADYWDIKLFEQYQKGDQEVFIKYINTFFLWDYVDEKYQIKSLFDTDFKTRSILSFELMDGHSRYLRGEEGYFLPSVDEMKPFLENAIWAIRRRGIFMLAMIKIATADMPKEQYKHDEWNVTDIYKEIFYYYSNPESPFVGTDDVINKTLSELKDKESRFSAYKDLTVDQQDKVKIILEAAKEAIML